MIKLLLTAWAFMILLLAVWSVKYWMQKPKKQKKDNRKLLKD